MVYLDADDDPLFNEETGKFSKRDIVQFVPLRDV
jgi:hypothetical protein